MSIFNIFRRTKRERKLNPESKWIVSIINGIISLTEPDGNESDCIISEIEKVIIETTDQGPFYPDVWWKIFTDEKVLIFPEGATGELEFFTEIQKLPEFNNEELAKSMSSTSNNLFVCWSKK